MKKPLQFSSYMQFKKMSYNDANRLFTNYYFTAYQDGYDDAIAKAIGVLKPPQKAPEPTKYVDEDEMRKILLSVKGIGEKRAQEVMKLIWNTQEQRETNA